MFPHLRTICIKWKKTVSAQRFRYAFTGIGSPSHAQHTSISRYSDMIRVSSHVNTRNCAPMFRKNALKWTTSCKRKDVIVWMSEEFNLLRAQRQRKASFKRGVKTDAVRITYHEFYGNNDVLTLLQQPIYSAILRLRLFANSCRYPISLILNTLAPNLYIAQEIYRLSL